MFVVDDKFISLSLPGTSGGTMPPSTMKQNHKSAGALPMRAAAFYPNHSRSNSFAPLVTFTESRPKSSQATEGTKRLAT